MFDPQKPQEVPLFVRAGRGIDLGPAPAGDLDGGNPDTAGGAMDQNLFPLLQPPQMVQGVVGREEGRRNRGRRFKGEAGRDR